VNKVKVFIHSITGIMPQILADQPGGGDTIIEKFEREAETSDYAIVLLTADDEGRNKADGGDLKDRARQNVILELGYFFGKLGRSKVVVLNGGVEQPSDVHGLNYIAYPSQMWTEDLRRELRNAGFNPTG
jgi:predicted nucleotide-binding protein